MARRTALARILSAALVLCAVACGSSTPAPSKAQAPKCGHALELGKSCRVGE